MIPLTLFASYFSTEWNFTEGWGNTHCCSVWIRRTLSWLKTKIPTAKSKKTNVRYREEGEEAIGR